MNFKELTKQIDKLSCINNVQTTVIGKSFCKRHIKAFHVGSFDKKQLVVIGAIHAREWITALLVIELVKDYAARSITEYGIYFIPLCNPDGVKIALEVAPLWKANARGVDLNVNFDACWGKGIQNLLKPGPENFIGKKPNSESEVKSLIKFTQQIKPCATIAYHSKGELVYYVNKRDQRLAEFIARETGYTATKPQNSTGGYSDWVSSKLEIPALTIEVGSDEYQHPINQHHLAEIYLQNKDVPEKVMQSVNQC